MTERQILAAVARADVFICAVLRRLPVVAAAGFVLALAAWRIIRMNGVGGERHE